MVRLTRRSLNRFPKNTDDENNRTNTRRSFVDYMVQFETSDHQFETDLKNIIKKGNTFNIIDCGAGEGLALDQLLLSKFAEHHIKKATGVSLHTFNTVHELLQKHKKLDWHIDNVFNVLPKLPPDYDFIVDMWGAYSYVEDRIELLRLYHNTLAPGGKAYIYCAASNCIRVKSTIERLERYLMSNYPSSFYFENNVLVMCKTSQRFPVMETINVEVCYYGSSVTTIENEEDAISGNAWYPRMVIFKCKPSSGPSLRRLPFQKSLVKNAIKKVY